MADAANDPKAAFSDQGPAACFSKPDVIFRDALFGSRQWHMNQAVANAMIEGYVPHPDFLEDGRLLCQGLITDEEMRERIKRRAMGKRL
jgi:hypothetical protein